MREIIFRGKSTRNGKWLYGSYIHQTEYFGDTAECHYIVECCPAKFNFKMMNYFPIDFETVGQYTGLTDKNGKKIFEGDIIKYKNTDGIKFNGVALTVIGKVVYNEKNASFAISGKDEIGAKHYDYFPIKNIEVIGNIFDNPELLVG